MLTLLHCEVSFNSTFDRNYSEGGNLFNAGTLVMKRSLIAAGTVSDANDGGAGAGLANPAMHSSRSHCSPPTTRTR